jgi:hypothetical protein
MPPCLPVLQWFWRPHLAPVDPYRPGRVARMWPGSLSIWVEAGRPSSGRRRKIIPGTFSRISHESPAPTPDQDCGSVGGGLLLLRQGPVGAVRGYLWRRRPGPPGLHPQLRRTVQLKRPDDFDARQLWSRWGCRASVSNTDTPATADAMDTNSHPKRCIGIQGGVERRTPCQTGSPHQRKTGPLGWVALPSDQNSSAACVRRFPRGWPMS